MSDLLDKLRCNFNLDPCVTTAQGYIAGLESDLAATTADRDAWRVSVEAFCKKTAIKIQEFIAMYKKAEAALTEIDAILNCGPEHPWHGCEAQEYSNSDHYDCHVREARNAIQVWRQANHDRP